MYRARPLTFALIACSVCLAPQLLPAQSGAPDWPQFRGPARDCVSTERGLLTTWPASGPPLAWKATGLGGGFSSVSVAGDRVYTMGNRGADSFLIALSRRDGTPVWSARVGPAGDNLGCTPTVDGDRVYAIGQEGDIVCAGVSDGSIRWRRNFKRDFGGNCGGWSYTESPLVDGGRVICTPGGGEAIVVALDKSTGETVWRCASPFPDATAGYSSVVVAAVGGVRHYVQLAAGGVVGARLGRQASLELRQAGQQHG